MIVTTRDVSFDVGGSRLIESISLTVRQGSLMAIVGPNGAGKSTLLGLLAGDHRPTSGSVLYDTHEASRISIGDLARTRSVLPQRQSEDVMFSVEEVVGMGRYAHRMDPIVDPRHDQTAIDRALDSVDLRGLRHRPVASLSGGERQRTAIARTLAQDTPLVLLDEPTTALDIGHRQMVVESLVALAGRGRTVVAVLHDLNLATQFNDVILLDRGSLAAHGRADEVLASDRLSDVYGYPIASVDHPLRPGRLILPRPPV